MHVVFVVAPSSVSTGLSPSTATAVVPYSPPDTVIDLQSLVPDTHAPGTLVTISATLSHHNVGRRYIGMAWMPASRNTFSKPPNSQTTKL